MNYTIQTSASTKVSNLKLPYIRKFKLSHEETVSLPSIREDNLDPASSLSKFALVENEKLEYYLHLLGTCCKGI